MFKEWARRVLIILTAIVAALNLIISAVSLYAIVNYNWHPGAYMAGFASLYGLIILPSFILLACNALLLFFFTRPNIRAQFKAIDEPIG